MVQDFATKDGPGTEANCQMDRTKASDGVGKTLGKKNWPVKWVTKDIADASARTFCDRAAAINHYTLYGLAVPCIPAAQKASPPLYIIFIYKDFDVDSF